MPHLLFTTKRPGPRYGVSLLLLAVVLLLAGCGDLFRPIANPIFPPGVDPQHLRIALVLSLNPGGTGTAASIDVSGDDNVGNHPLGGSPVHAAFAPTGTLAYVANWAGDSVSVLNAASTASATTISLASGSKPIYIARGANTAFTANSGDNTISVITSVGGVESVSDNITLDAAPVSLALTPDGTKLYCLKVDGTAAVVNTANNSIAASIFVGGGTLLDVGAFDPASGPRVWTAMRPDGSAVYVLNPTNSTVYAIDVASNTVNPVGTVGSAPSEIVFDNALKRIYVVNSGSNSVSVFDANVSPPTFLRNVNTGGSPRALTALADGSRFYVVNSADNNLSVFDAASLSLRKTVGVGTTPVWVDSSPESSKVYAVSQSSGDVSILRTSDDSVVTTLPAAGPSPVFVAVSH